MALKDCMSYLKFVKLHTAILKKIDMKLVEKIMKQEGDINYKLANTGLLKSQSSDLVGCTILHVGYWQACDIYAMEFLSLLLNHGADFTIKTSKGQTVIHESIAKATHINCWIPDRRLDLVLSAHLKFEIIANPIDDNGLSHFHAACMMNNVKAIEFFLNNGVSIDQSVKVDSPIFAGYTPLHFATRFVCLEAVELLLRRGAKVNIQNARMMTPLHLILDETITRRRADVILESRLDIIEQVANNNENINAQDHFGLSYLHVICTFKDSSKLKLHLNEIQDINRAVNVDSPICPGFSPLHVAALFNIDSLKLLLARGADITIEAADQSTALDLCIARYEIEVIRDIIGCSIYRDLMLSDLPLKLMDLVSSMTQSGHFKQLLREFGGSVNANIPVDSALWPGYTPLHLAIIFMDRRNIDEQTEQMLVELIVDCLKNGADLTSTGVDGRTPLQFAFRRRQEKAVHLMLQYQQETANRVDEDGLSHLHIACASNNMRIVEALLKNGADVNCKLGSTFQWYVESKFIHIRRVFLCAGSTPLHIAVATDNYEMVELLLKHRADLQAQDANGMSAVHRLLTCYDNNQLCSSLLLSSKELYECVADSCGLSHLHVACFKGHLNAVKRCLLVSGSTSEVNRVVRCKRFHNNGPNEGQHESCVDGYRDPSVNPLSALMPFDGYTPLRIAMASRHYEVANLLLKHGASVLPEDIECYWNLLFSVIRTDRVSRQSFVQLTGMTDLHLACYERNLRQINELLAAGADVNAQIEKKSPLWPGYTPLCVLLLSSIYDSSNSDPILQLLLDYGADITISDGRKTFLHLANPDRYYISSGCCNRYSSARTSEGGFFSIDHDIETLPAYPCDHSSLMLRSIKDFTSNPTNDQGISFFHIACKCQDVAAVKGFLNHGVDVNSKIDYFSNTYGGYTPLHMTLTRRARSPNKILIIDLLIKHGADVHAESYSGNTPLHYAALYYVYVGQTIFTMIVNAGANMHSKNVEGLSALEILFEENIFEKKELDYFIQSGFRLNNFNCQTDEGLIPILLGVYDLTIKELEEIFRNNSEVDEMGRSVIHNIASTDSREISQDYYSNLIKQVEKLGYDVDDQDKSGQTALHAAARFQNEHAISALLLSGADINIIDLAGKTAFDYSLDSRSVYNYEHHTYEDIVSEEVVQLFLTHVHKLELAHLHINAFNMRSRKIAYINNYCISNWVYDERRFNDALGKIYNTKLASLPLTIGGLMSENTVLKYSKMPILDRQGVVESFESMLQWNSNVELGELTCLVKLQYRHVLARLRLIEAAKLALNIIANISVPDLCSEAIFALFRNWELRSVIVAAG